MASTNPRREEMIGKLVEHSVSTAVAESPQDWLKEVFEKGFVGFGRLTDRQLQLEMRLRGLLADDDADEEEFDDDLLGEAFFS